MLIQPKDNASLLANDSQRVMFSLSGIISITNHFNYYIIYILYISFSLSPHLRSKRYKIMNLDNVCHRVHTSS